jgi:hypothetical protein
VRWLGWFVTATGKRAKALEQAIPNFEQAVGYNPMLYISHHWEILCEFFDNKDEIFQLPST